METMTEDKKYEGWANYPTWCVQVWLTNDKGLYDRTIETLKGAEEFYDGDEATHGPYRVFIADWLKDHINEDVFLDAFNPDLKAQSSLADDLAQWALGQIDWLEIADAWIEDTKEG